jgi:hypothetical protein
VKRAKKRVKGYRSGTSPLILFSHGLITKEQAIENIGLRDYSELLIALGDASIPLPSLPAPEIEKQAILFAKIWNVA